MLHSLKWIKRKEMLKLAVSDVKRFEDLIFGLLERYRALRDDTHKLYLACIMEIRGRDYINNITLLRFFTEDVNKQDLPKVPTMASVIRLSTKLQKEYPHLRGEHWEERQRHSKDYKEDLGYGS